MIREQQRAWAEVHRIEIDRSGYTRLVDDNLFTPLSGDTRLEFESGDGTELGVAGSRGKMQALHSSSALACNVFDYWRGRDRAPLATALDAGTAIEDIEFERKFPTGLAGNSPNLDVVLTLSDASFIAIESKFLEPYGAHGARGFKAKYFESPDGLWERRGLVASQRIAVELQSGALSYRWLNAEQLLKHVLGLATSDQGWSLWYVWYQAPGEPGLEHAAEAQDFADRLDADGIGLRSLTYQELHESLSLACGNEHRDYIEYLSGRYFEKSD